MASGYSSSRRTKTHSPQTLEERRLIWPYVLQDLINLVPDETALRVLHHLVLGGEKLLVCLMWWTIKKVLNLKRKIVARAEICLTFRFVLSLLPGYDSLYSLLTNSYCSEERTRGHFLLFGTLLLPS